MLIDPRGHRNNQKVKNCSKPSDLIAIMLHKKKKKDDARLALEVAESQTSRNISLPSSTNTSINHRNLCSLNIDSEDTLSNAEFIPNSHLPEAFMEAARKNKSSSNGLQTMVQPKPGKKYSRSVTYTISGRTNIDNTQNSLNYINQAKLQTNHIVSGSNTASGSQLRYYVESSGVQSNGHISKGSQDSGQAYLENLQETRWLRHYERPSGTSLHGRKKLIDPAKAVTKKRGRPTKQKAESFPLNLDINKRQRIGKDNLEFNQSSTSTTRTKLGTRERKHKAPANGQAFNGSPLTTLELEKLFYKYAQHGHFRHDPQHPTVTIERPEIYRNLTLRNQYYYSKRYNAPNSYCKKTDNNFDVNDYSHLDKHLPTHSNSNRSCSTNNFSDATHGSRFTKINENTDPNFSNTLGGQTMYPKNVSSYSMSSPYPNSEVATSAWAYEPSFSMYNNCMQPGYYGVLYQPNFYNNNQNVENNAYQNNQLPIQNSAAKLIQKNIHGDTKNISAMKDNSGNNVTRLPNSQPTKLVACKGMDLTTQNGSVNNFSTNCINVMQNSPANDTKWNLSNVNQPIDTVNQVSSNGNSMNQWSQSADCTLVNNVTKNASSMMNYQNPCMNQGFPAMPEWYNAMYDPYLSNGSSYYNMFNPHDTFMGSDPANYPYPNQQNVTANTTNPWMQNMVQENTECSTSNSSNSAEFFGMNSSQRNDMNQGMNGLLTTDAVTNTTVSQTNVGNGDNNALYMAKENQNEQHSSNEQVRENTFVPLPTDCHVEKNDNHQEYTIPTYLNTNSLALDTHSEDINFDNVLKTKADEHAAHQNDLTQILNDANQRLDSFENYFNQMHGYPSGSETFPPQCDTKETESSKLRELAEFAKLFSDDYIDTPVSIVQGDETEIQ